MTETVASPQTRAGAPPWVLGHRPSLDSVRGLAVLSVLFGHFDVPGFAAGGTVGVALFFALSGYLITSRLLGESMARGRIDLQAFYMRRARRLLPGLAILLTVLASWAVATGQFGAWLPGGLAVTFYVANWAWILHVPLIGLAHAWSLAIEEQFYFLWPIALQMMQRRGHNIVLPLTLAAIALSYALTFAHLDNYLLAFAGSDARAKDLLVGCAIALISVRRGRDLQIPTAAAAAAAGLLVVVASGRFVAINALITAVPCAILVAWFAARPNFARWRPITFTGRISYGLYLYHYPMAFGPLGVFDGMDTWPRAVALFAATYALASLSWFVVERRFIRRSVVVATGAAVRPELQPAVPS